MNKTHRLFVTINLILTILICNTACADLSIDSSDFENYQNGTVTAYISNYSDIFNETKNSRKLISNTDVTKNYRYFLYGEPIDAKILDVTEVTPINGNFQIEIGSFIWNLSLFIVEDSVSVNTNADVDELSSKASFVGKAFVDFSEKKSDINFPILPCKNGKGNISLSIGLDDWTLPENCKMTVELRDSFTGEVIYADNTSTEREFDAKNFFVYDLENKEIDAGIYNLVVTLYEGKSSSSDKKAEWSNSIMISANRNCSAVIKVPDVLNAKPVAPENFVAGYKPMAQNQDAETFEVGFSWKCNSQNTEYFELQVTDSDWNSARTFSGNVTNEEDYAGGSLFANSSSLFLRLSLAKNYSARIRSCSKAGHSDWVYADLSGKDSVTINGVSCKPFEGAKTINLYRIVYHLKGGKYRSLEGEFPRLIYSDRCVFITQKSDAEKISLWNGSGYDDDDDSNTDYLVKDSAALSYWISEESWEQEKKDDRFALEYFDFSGNAEFCAIYNCQTRNNVVYFYE